MSLWISDKICNPVAVLQIMILNVFCYFGDVHDDVFLLDEFVASFETVLIVLNVYQFEPKLLWQRIRSDIRLFHDES